MAVASKGTATKSASWKKAFETLPSTLLNKESWDKYGSEFELLTKMMNSLTYFNGKVTLLNYLAGNKGELVCGDRTLSRKEITLLISMLKEEFQKVTPIMMLYASVGDVTYKTPMSLCRVDPVLRDFFLGTKAFPRVDLGKVYAMQYSPLEQLLMKKIGERRQKLIKERFAKTGLPGAKERALETFVSPFEIPRSSESANHVFQLVDRDLLDASLLKSGWATQATVSAVMSIYFRKFGLNIGMAQRGQQGVRETPKVKFDKRMVAFFGKTEYKPESDADGKRRKARQSGSVFTAEDMSEKGVSYLLAIQRIVATCTQRRKDLSGSQLEEYDRMEVNVAEMQKIRDAARAVVETKRYYKELTERDKRRQRQKESEGDE